MGSVRCSPKFNVVLLTAYVVAIAAALANPARIDYTDAYLMAQAANVATLLVEAWCRQSSGHLAVAAALGTALVMRAGGLWKGGTRWDSLLVTVGLLINLQKLFKYAVPARVPHRWALYLLFSCLAMPVIAATPHLLHLPAVDDSTLRTALGLAREGYGITSDASDQLGGPLWTLYDEGTDTRAALRRVSHGGRSDLFVYFAGSRSEQNWRTNVNVLVDALPEQWCGRAGMRTHKGFQTAFASVSQQLLAALRAAVSRSDDERVVFVGHSLGGALATLAGLFFACQFPGLRHRAAVVTFGAPQVGDGAFVKFFNEVVPVCARVVNPIDPVPRLLDIQLVQTKGYYPVGSLSTSMIAASHALDTYARCLAHGKTLRILLAFWPAVAAAMLIAVYVAWRLRT